MRKDTAEYHVCTPECCAHTPWQTRGQHVAARSPCVGRRSRRHRLDGRLDSLAPELRHKRPDVRPKQSGRTLMPVPHSTGSRVAATVATRHSPSPSAAAARTSPGPTNPFFHAVENQDGERVGHGNAPLPPFAPSAGTAGARLSRRSPRFGSSNPVDPAGVAALPGVVGVYVCHAGIGEQSFDEWQDAVSLRNPPAGRHG